MNKNIHLPIDDDEQDLMSSLENGEWKEVSDIEKYRNEAIRYADSTIKVSSCLPRVLVPPPCRGLCCSITVLLQIQGSIIVNHLRV